MTTDKLRSVLRFYREWIKQGWMIEPCQSNDKPTHFGHLAWMCEQAEAFATEHCDKAMRWLGYIQGVLVARGYFKLTDVRTHSRTEGES